MQENERIDDLQNGYYIIQDPKKFCFGIDAVLLSDFAAVRKEEKVLDMGTGTGIIPILMCARNQSGHFTGLEIQEDFVSLARKSILMNRLDKRIDIVQGDIKEAALLFGAASFHVVTCNPPYMIQEHGGMSPAAPRAIARHEVLCRLEDVVCQTAKVLKDRGRLYLVHRPFRLAEIIDTLCRYHLEPKRMRLVHPFVDKEPNMVLIEAAKGGRPRLKVEAPLIVYQKNGEYTDEIHTIYGRKPDQKQQTLAGGE